MLENKDLKMEILRKTSQVIDDSIQLANAITGEQNHLYHRLKSSIARAEKIDVIVSFLMESGVRLLLKDLEEAINKGVQIRILTGNYLNITQPSALYLLRDRFGDKIDLRFYNIPNKSFHPKSYIFHNKQGSELYIGSSNISRSALTSAIEWNYRLVREGNELDFDYFSETFNQLFDHHSLVVTDEVLKNYSKSWSKPKISSAVELESKSEVVPLFEPRGAQIEALYALKQTKEEGAEKAIVVAATGIGKTYLAAFDSMEFKKILFVAHREEILKQAAVSFRNVRKSESVGFFQGSTKDIDQEVTLALVQTLGKKEYLDSTWFKPDAFDYIIIDEFHHATAQNYRNIIDYFKPQFLLGLTATPERLDNKNVFALCDYNLVYEVRLKEAINKGWLVPFRYFGIYDDTVDYGNIKTNANGRYDIKNLEEELMIHKRAEFILKNYQKYNSKRAMGFCTSKKHADFMATYFTNQGVPSVAVFSGDQGESTEERDTALSKLHKGEVQVVFSVDMFNEGVDVPSIDMVLFLRPTESPTVFLQQLGRGLRKYKDKEYLIVLDFIGNYKKANLIPFLLSGNTYDKVTSVSKNPLEFEFPEECQIDFDFRLIDLFKVQAQQEMTIKDKVKHEYMKVKSTLGYVPSRVEFFLEMDSDIYQNLKGKAALNPFNDYLEFLKELGELDEEEERLYDTLGREFINRIERTSMSKTYKMPVLLAFYNKGNIKLEITSEDIVAAFKEFYHYGANGKDLIRDKSTADYKEWEDKKWLSLATRNPVKFLLKSESAFFEEKEGYILALNNVLKEIKGMNSFKKHFKDAIEYRTLNFYKERLDKESD